MSEKTLKNIFGALGVLLVFWAISTLISNRGGQGHPGEASIAEALEDLDATT